MALSWPSKDPDAKLDYMIDWSDWLAENDTIILSDWIIPANLTLETQSKTTTSTTVWLTDGVVGETYEIVNRITTADGRIQDQTVKLKCKER